MRTARRRRLDRILLGFGAVVGGGIVAIGSAVGDGERIPQIWVGAELSAEGGTQVTEAIDYDFGLIPKHGIFRTIPGLALDSVVTVASATAPDDIAAFTPVYVGGEPGMEVKVGDPNTTINGRHRYLLDYELPRAVLLDPSDTLAWDAVGTKWTVTIQRAEVHIVAPWELLDATCHVGAEGATGGCELREVEPGHLVTEVEDLDPGEGVTVRAERGEALAATPNVPAPPVTAPPDPGIGLLLPAVAAAAAGLGGALTTSSLVRRSGRERVGTGGVSDAAFAGSGAPSGEVRLDEADLAEMATTEFAPPTELTPAQGGLLHAEVVRPAHKVAWLIQAAIDGEIELVEEGKDVRLVRKGGMSGPLATAFGGRDEVELGSYDSTFARGWGQIDDQLKAWSLTSGLWDPLADRRKTSIRVLGGLAMVAGAIVSFFGGFATSRWGEGWLVVIVIGALLGGGGFAALLRGWELRVRTPYGSGLWLRVESFRRFLHESETFHAEEAAKRGVLREYTAWAVALDEIDRWERAVTTSTTIPEDAGLRYVHMAPILFRSTASASTAPSSSGSGSGGGGGSVGGGGGGGGGGSW
ncbi:MAG: DUF2207 domain-containing protein [Acidimicrobiales bacterium]